MIKKYIKVLTIMLVALFGGLTIISCSDDNDNGVESTLTYDDLPTDAKSFLNKFFYEYEITKIESYSEKDITVYEVYLQDGYEVVFNETGEWQQVVAPYKETIPYGIVPEVIQQYLDYNYSGYGVTQINTTGQGYKVELVTGLNLYFNMSGEVIDMGNTF